MNHSYGETKPARSALEGTSTQFFEGHTKLHGINTTFPPCDLPHCAGSPVRVHSTNIPAGCEECVAECDVETCDLGMEGSQCTDRCLVVPCDDPCPDICATACCTWSDHPPYETELYQGADEKSGRHLDVASTGHNDEPFSNNLPFQHVERNGPQLDWNNTSLSRELDALICACTTSQHHCDACDPSLLSIDKSSLHSHHHRHPSIPRSFSVDMSRPDSPASVLCSPMISGSASTRSSPEPSSSSTSDTQSSQKLVTQENDPHFDIGSFQPQPPGGFVCLWAQCGKPFRSSLDLIAHVNDAHLQLPIAPESLPLLAMPSRSSLPSTFRSRPENLYSQDPNSVSCMWGDCNVYPTLSHIPGPSTGDASGAALGLVASHLLQDHLGVSIPHSLTTALEHSARVSESRPRDDVASASLHRASPNISAPPPSQLPPIMPQPLVSPPSNDVTQSSSPHRCQWEGCIYAQAPFGSSAELTAHITDVHVGGGKNRYDCMWIGCSRHGATGFSSKQKILRHIQSHTGHRPFRCATCDQYFSEAATLQQHMRRHTKEKPYACDFPGCNKAFAITGALTIHKRTHSGTKPFKCPYCERSFSESSNLSKHIRTHTGDRPYPCSHPGCEKRFARPDQVARHMNVHKKKKKGVEDSEGVMGDLDDTQEMEVEENVGFFE